MAITNIKRFADAHTNGETWTSWFHKTSTPVATASNTWLDLSMGAGIPKYNAYVGVQLAATQLTGFGNDGIYLGPLPSAGKSRYINSVMMQSSSLSAAPAHVTICDYLLHYPLVDCDSIDLQETDNTQTLPRYSSGAGVMCFVVVTTPMTANANITIKYTNSAGVSNRTSTFSLISSTATGQIVSSANTSSAAGSKTPFIPLQGGDLGIRSIESAQLSTPAGGFVALVLVKPLTAIQMLEQNVAAEIYQLNNKSCMLPKIESGAYLNLVVMTGNVSGLQPFRGAIETIWQ